MQRPRLHFTLAMLLLTLAIGDAAAQAPTSAPRAQQGPTSEEIERLRRELELARQQPGQPLLVVPAPAPTPPAQRPELPTVELSPLLERVERASGKRFVVDGRLGTRLYLAGVEPNEVTYPILLSILRMNGFAAFETEGRVNIVPDATIRFFETRIVPTDDESIPAEEFVTRVLTPTNIQAVMLVPILRPLMPQAAHLAAHSDSNQLILMDRYANVRRITEIVRLLDVAPRD